MKVLLATDGSAGALVAARFLAANLDPARTAVEVATVEEWSPLEDSWVVRETFDLAAAPLPLPADSPLAAACGTLAGAGFGVTAAILSGHAAEAIPAHAQAAGADLIVLGSRGLHGWRRIVAGSVSTAVAEMSVVPVLVAGRDAPVHRVVVGWDGSAACASALDAIVGLPFRWRPEIVLCAAFEARPPLLSGIAPTMMSAVEDAYLADLAAERAAAEERVAEAVRELERRGVAVSAAVEHGPPVGVLLAASDSLGTSLIAVGAHGHGALHRLFLGSTTAELLGTGHLNVLVARVSAAVAAARA